MLRLMSVLHRLLLRGGGRTTELTRGWRLNTVDFLWHFVAYVVFSALLSARDSVHFWLHISVFYGVFQYSFQ